MPGEPLADLIYPYTRRMTGIRRYSEKLLAAFIRTGTPVRAHRVRKIEFSLGGKPAGGLLSQKFFSSIIGTSCPVVHSLSPDVITRHTNVATIHDIIPLQHRELFMNSRREKAGYSIMFGRLEKLTIIVHTAHIKEQLVKQGIDHSRIEVCGSSVGDFFRPSGRPSPYSADGRKHLVTVGDYNPRKRYDVLYRAVNMLEGVDLYHIGPVNSWAKREAELKAIAAEGDGIHMLGSLPDDTLVDYLSHADLFVYASEEEGAGYTPAEALACGTPALVNRIPVFTDQFGSDVSYCSLEPDSFAGAIMEALGKEVDREALLRAAARFSPDEEARRVAAVYRKVAVGQ